MSRSWKRGSTRRWRRIRRSVLAANEREHGGLCRLQLEHVCTGVATQVHHVLGRRVTGDDPRYLAATCAECNRAVGDPSPDASAVRPRRVSSW